MKKSTILTIIAGFLFMFVVVSQGNDSKVVAKLEVAQASAMIPFQVIDMVYVAQETEETIPWLYPQDEEDMCRGFLTQVFRPPATINLNRVASFSEHRS